jgi:threonine aldolase
MNMLNFRNDYGAGCIPEILEEIKNNNNIVHTGYGLDEQCEKAKEVIHSKMPDNDVDIYFVQEGTQANIVMIRCALKSYEAVIAPDTGHIVRHETGAIEATGHKVIIVPNHDGKITPDEVQKTYESHMIDSEKCVLPKMVYISNCTELGTVYKREELEALHAKCQELGLYLIMDGDRMNTVLMSGVDYTLNDLPKWCDMFSIGGTKAGALFGEAVIVSNPELKPNFRYVLRQSAALIARGWLLGVQFRALFENDAFYKNAAHEIELAQQIQSFLHDNGYSLLIRSETNLVFPVLTKEQFEYLAEYVDFDVWEKRDDMLIIRLVTSWSTTQEEVDQLCTYLKKASELV